VKKRKEIKGGRFWPWENTRYWAARSYVFLQEGRLDASERGGGGGWKRINEFGPEWGERNSKMQLCGTGKKNNDLRSSLQGISLNHKKGVKKMKKK